MTFESCDAGTKSFKTPACGTVIAPRTVETMTLNTERFVSVAELIERWPIARSKRDFLALTG